MIRSLKYTTAPNIVLSRPLTMEILDLEKLRFSVFPKNDGENYFRFRFPVQIRVLHPRLGQKRQ